MIVCVKYSYKYIKVCCEGGFIQEEKKCTWMLIKERNE
jgi:hypothetical protein